MRAELQGPSAVVGNVTKAHKQQPRKHKVRQVDYAQPAYVRVDTGVFYAYRRSCVVTGNLASGY
jgi:hypothetical protein